VDICMTCGKELETGRPFGAKCEEGHLVVHQEECQICERLCGVMAGDDFCGVDMLVCPDCVDKVRKQAS